MPTEAKQATVAELKEEFSNSRAAIVADYRGLTVSDISAVRRALRGEGISYRVVKNRLAKIAATESGRGELNELLQGPTALALGKGDEVTLARTFLDAIRPYRSVVIRGGVIGDRRIDAASVTRLATLPPREVLLAQLAGGMASPMTTMASLLAAPLRNLAYALAQLSEKKGAAAPADAPQATAEAPEAEAPAAEAAAEAPEAEAAAEAPEAEAIADTPAEAPEAEAAADAAAEAPEAEATAEATDDATPEEPAAADSDDTEQN